jgi:hypothetical protein
MGPLRWPIILTAALCLMVVAAAGARPTTLQSQSAAPPPSGPPEAPPQPPKCGTPNPRSPLTVTTQVAGTELDGGRGNDKIISNLPNTVCGFRGKDFIDAHNGQPQDIDGGPGIDRAVIDDQDVTNLANVERCKMSKGQSKWRPCPHSYSFSGDGLFGPSALSAATFTYPEYVGNLECRIFSGARQIIFLREPTIRAVDATQYTDWQTVAYESSLYKWDGSQWVYFRAGAWLWDHTFDEGTKVPFIGNYWRAFQTRKRGFYWFDNLDPGIYRVAVTYHWYPTKTVPAHEDLVWAGPHYGPYQDPSQQWCNFPA